MDFDERRKGFDVNSADRIYSLGLDESSLSPSRAAVGLSANTGSSGAIDIRAECGRKSVRLVRKKSHARNERRRTMEAAVEKSRINRHKIVSPVVWLAARKRYLLREKEFTRLRDELSRERRELPWETGGEALCFRGEKWQADARRPFRRSQPAVRISLHARSWMEGGLPWLLIRERSFRWGHHPPRESRRHFRRRVSRATGRDRGVQKANGLEVQVGVLVRKRFQLRLSRFVQEG